MNWIDNSQLSLRSTISTWLYALSTFKWYDLARRHVHSFIYRRTKKKKCKKNISNFKWVACILWCFLIPRNCTRKNRKISDKVWLLFWQWLFITWAANAQFNSLQLKIFTCTAFFVFVTEWPLNLMLLPESQTKYALTMLWTRVQTDQSTWFINGVSLSFILLWALRLFGVFHFAVKVFSDNAIYMSRFICFYVDFLHIFIGDHVENQQVWWKIELWISEICILNTRVPI